MEAKDPTLPSVEVYKRFLEERKENQAGLSSIKGQTSIKSGPRPTFNPG